MKEKNLPIKLIMQKNEDIKKNLGGGDPHFFGDVTNALQTSVEGMLVGVLDYYSKVFEENALVPAVGKITVKPEAIAKSHKPNDFCRNFPIIGSEDMGEILIKVNSSSIRETVKLVKNPPSEKFKANLTAIDNITPVTGNDKISVNILNMHVQNSFNSIKSRIKIKLFDFDDDFDNAQISDYVFQKMDECGFNGKYDVIKYGSSIMYIKVEVEKYDDIVKLADINGIKSIDFFQEYSQPLMNYDLSTMKALFDKNAVQSDVIIGIIDGGISDDNIFLKPYIIARENHISAVYHNSRHATFIASTIQYGNELNGISAKVHNRYKFVDIIAIPNSDEDFGPTDSIKEDELMEIIEETMEKYAYMVKIWNISLGIDSLICNGTMSDLGIFLDYIQDKYQVQIFVSSGNLNEPPLREWPPQDGMGDRDRIISPADSVRAITVGSIALYDSNDSIVKRTEPSPFSRRGPGANYIVKPDVVDYGGNLSKNYSITGLGMKGLDPSGNVIEGNGTSYSTPRIAQKFAGIFDEMVDKDLLLAKAILIHSARMNTHDSLDANPQNIKYYGFGIPSDSIDDILLCSEDEITLVFKQKVKKGTHLEMMDFPFPKSLIRRGKCYGEIGMTLVYNPILDEKYGCEYCRANIDVSFGVYKYKADGKMSFKGQVPLECTWDEQYERERVENGFKWSPIKSYYRKIKKGVDTGNGWKIRIDLTERNEISIIDQEFVLIVTIRDPNGNDIYSEVVNGLKERGYITNNLEVKQQLRQRQ